MNVSRSSIRRICLLWVVAAPCIVDAQAGKSVVSHDGNCQVMVPADWASSGNFGLATSADKSMSVIVSSPNLSPTLEIVKRNAPTIYADDKIVKSTATEFQMEGQDPNGKPNVYRAVQVPNRVCLVEITYGDSIDDARTIAETLKSAK
ncbi:MAG TPA: hypothetical protein VHZ28_18995 [Terracidiphilus sp.]|jgi:hypothetical protein|nr:hypothetical protein [Terracidiphilus sp.]